MAGPGPLTPNELASRPERLSVTSGERLTAKRPVVASTTRQRRYSLQPEQAIALTDESSAAYLPGFFQIALGSVLDSPRYRDRQLRRWFRLARTRP